MIEGILAVKKPSSMTSRDVVNIISRKMHTKKVGHCGTLDPLATGVLIVCIGKSTKLVELLQHQEKEYVFTCCLGMHTDTLDCEGTVLQEESVTLSKEEIEKGLEAFVKTYEQEVPIYSAVKIGGKKLYEYARAKKEVSLPTRSVTIFEAELTKNPWYEGQKTYFEARVKVSSGTYIRSLIRDIARFLGTVGIMTSLVRTKQGFVSLEEAYTLEEIEQDTYHFIEETPLFLKYPKIEVSLEEKKRILNGALLPYQNVEICLFTYQGENLALYKRYEKDPTFMKPWKMLKNE